jgi:hypothetical protein
MPTDRSRNVTFGAYSVERVWLIFWRWRLAQEFGAHAGIGLTLASAKFAARQRLRDLRARRANDVEGG